jgi:hypothetical protein
MQFFQLSLYPRVYTDYYQRRQKEQFDGIHGPTRDELAWRAGVAEWSDPFKPKPKDSISATLNADSSGAKKEEKEAKK